MGLALTIRFSSDEPPSWAAIQAQLARLGESVGLRMIDGLPAFPDEIPAEGWAELRLGFPTGMVTLRRAPATLTCVIWGNADPPLTAARDRLAWACAAAGAGRIDTAEGAVSEDEFAHRYGLSPA